MPSDSPKVGADSHHAPLDPVRPIRTLTPRSLFSHGSDSYGAPFGVLSRGTDDRTGIAHPSFRPAAICFAAAPARTRYEPS